MRGVVSARIVVFLLSSSTIMAVVAVSTSTSNASDVSAAIVDMPSARVGQQMVCDEESNRIVMFGGEDGPFKPVVDTWTYDITGNRWQNMSPSVSPPPHISPGMVYDSKADLVILFGGNDALHDHALNDTWTYDLNQNTWTEMLPSASPPVRIGPHMTYDEKLDRVIMFGGMSEHDVFAFTDTWTYDLTSNIWTPVTTATSPTERCLAAMAYDTESDRVLLFGGYRFALENPDAETWMYDPNNETWSKMAPAMNPAARFDAGSAYDSGSDRFLVFGGEGIVGVGYNDTWAYDLNSDAWSKIVTASAPSVRIWPGMVYQTESDRTVLFGGTWPRLQGDLRGDTWVFDYENSTWTMVLPDIVKPTLAIISPADGASLASSELNVTGTASDNLGVAKVEVSLDNNEWAVATGTTTWYATISLAEGENTIYIRVTDVSGNAVTSMIQVTAPSKDMNILVWAVVVAAGIIVVAAVAYVMIRRRKK